MTYQSWRKTKEYSKWRKAVFIRDHFRCKYPGCKRRRKIQAHHIIKYEYAPMLIFDVKNGITLCSYHHYFIRNKEHLYIELFLDIIREHNSRH